MSKNPGAKTHFVSKEKYMEDSQTIKSGIGKDIQEGNAEFIRSGATSGASGAFADPSAVLSGGKVIAAGPQLWAGHEVSCDLFPLPLTYLM